jgi:hypothetical protein
VPNETKKNATVLKKERILSRIATYGAYRRRFNKEFEQQKQHLSPTAAADILLEEKRGYDFYASNRKAFEDGFTAAFKQLPDHHLFKRFAMQLALARAERNPNNPRPTEDDAAREGLAFLNRFVPVRWDRKSQTVDGTVKFDDPTEKAAFEVFVNSYRPGVSRRTFMKGLAGAFIAGGLASTAIGVTSNPPQTLSDEELERSFTAANPKTAYAEMAKKFNREWDKKNTATQYGLAMAAVSFAARILLQKLDERDSPETVLNKAAEAFESAAYEMRSQLEEAGRKKAADQDGPSR